MLDRNEIEVFRDRDNYGPVVVTEDALSRTLYFGTHSKQSRMLINQPAIPILRYSQAMLLGLHFVPNPKRVLFLGLGGGSLVKFFLKHVPGCAITVVELRQKVIDVAHAFFAVPESHPALTIVNQNALDFLSAVTPASFDVVLVDIFDAFGPAEELTQKQFLRRCLAATTSDGLLVFNSWIRGPGHTPPLIKALKKNSDHELFNLFLGDYNSNVVTYCFKKEFALQGYGPTKQALLLRSADWALDLAPLFDLLWEQNTLGVDAIY